MKTAQILLTAIAAFSLLSCNSVFKAAKEGEGDPIGNPHKPGDIYEHQQDTIDTIQDRRLR